MTGLANRSSRELVQAIRHLLAQRHLAMLICAATLLLRLLVPAGHMIDSDHGRLTITVCTGSAPRTVTIDVPGMRGEMPQHDGSKGHGKAEMPCAFASLSAASVAAVDAILLGGLIAFVMRAAATGLVPPPPTRPAYLRPPLRGPPARL